MILVSLKYQKTIMSKVCIVRQNISNHWNIEVYTLSSVFSKALGDVSIEKSEFRRQLLPWIKSGKMDGRNGPPLSLWCIISVETDGEVLIINHFYQIKLYYNNIYLNTYETNVYSIKITYLCEDITMLIYLKYGLDISRLTSKNWVLSTELWDIYLRHDL